MILIMALRIFITPDFTPGNSTLKCQALKPFLCLVESSDSVTFDNIELITDVLVENSVRLDTSSFGLIGNAYASLFDSANLIMSGSFSVSIGISFPYRGFSYGL